MPKCEDCGEEVKRRFKCPKCLKLICSWCWNHIHAIQEAKGESAGLADWGEALEWERNIHEQLDTLGAPRKSVDGFDFSINGRFAFLRYRAADPAQGQSEEYQQN